MVPAETQTCTMTTIANPDDDPKHNFNGSVPPTSDPNKIIQRVDQEGAGLATPAPLRLDLDQCPWLQRWRIRNELSSAQRRGLVGAADIAVRRQLTMMGHAAEGAILMAKKQWEGLVQLHGAQQLKQFGAIFLELQDSFMDQVVDATAKVHDRATQEFLRIEEKGYPEFVKTPALEENQRRFHSEMEVVRTISERIGETLRTRLGEGQK